MTLLFASLVGLAAIGAFLARAAAAPDESRATRLVRGALLAFTVLVAVEILLGVAHHLTPAATLAALGLAAGGAWVLARRAGPSLARPRAPWTALEAALATALVAAFAFRLWAGLHRTTFLYDALSYHLHAPVTWMHDRRLEIVPSPFGDPAPAYAPANVELWFLFLLAPLRSDVLASAGQLPFAALAALAIAAAAREAGTPRSAALGAALAFLLVPEVWQQIPTAMADLGMASLMLAALPFIARLPRGATRADLIALGAALGLAAGSKYVGALLACPFAVTGAVAAWRGRTRARDLVFAAGAAAVGCAYWPLRNLLVTGNPLFPVSAFGFSGLYDGRAMRQWDYHLPIGAVGALGAMLLETGVGFSIAAALALARGWRRRELPLAVGLVTLFWLAVPYQESRFLFPAFGVAALALGRLSADPPPWLSGAALATAIGGSLIEWPTSERLWLVPAALGGGLVFAVFRRAPFRVPRTGRRVAVLAVFAFLFTGVSRYRDGDRGYTLGADIDESWAWLRTNVHGAHVAYTGTNLAFPLAGRDLANVVRYVNVAGAAEARLHDFPRPPSEAPNAEPALYRDGASFDRWLANLRATQAQIVFVAALEPIVRRSIAADADGFPIERAWADAHPALFRLRHASPAARVYEVTP